MEFITDHEGQTFACVLPSSSSSSLKKKKKGEEGEKENGGDNKREEGDVKRKKRRRRRRRTKRSIDCVATAAAHERASIDLKDGGRTSLFQETRSTVPRKSNAKVSWTTL